MMDNKMIFNISYQQLQTSKVREITENLDNASDPQIWEVERHWTFFSLKLMWTHRYHNINQFKSKAGPREDVYLYPVIWIVHGKSP